MKISPDQASKLEEYYRFFLGNLPSRIIRSVSDSHGRWTRTHIQIKDRKCLVVYNTYRTHAKSLATAGVDTPWMQQWKSIREATGKDVDPRRQHVEDLLELIEADVSDNNFPVILGDFNEDLSDSEEHGLQLLETSPHVVNVFLHFHGQVPSSRENNRSICHIYISPNLIPFVSRIGIATEHDGFALSDHIPFFFDLKQELFQTKSFSIDTMQTRILQMYDRLSVERYVEEVLRRLNCNNVVERLSRLRTYINDHGFDESATANLEKLDSQVTQSML